MKKIALLAVLCFLTLGIQAQDYIKKQIWEMTGTADLIVVGKISAVKGNDITLQPTQIVSGDKPEGDFSYAAFRTLKSAKRWGKYLVGEEVLLFLQKDGDKFKIMGDAGEGEKLVMNGKAYLDSRGDAIFNKFNYFPLPSGKGTSIYAEELDLNELVEAIKAYPTCFEVGHKPRQDKMGAMYEGAYAVPKCEDKEMTRLRLVNLIADKMVDQSLAAPQ